MINLNVKDFTRAAKTVGAIIERRNVIPILGAMRARANGKLELQGTDLDTTVTVTIPCDTDRHVEFIISDHRSLLSAISAAGGADFEIDVRDTGYVATAGQLKRETTVQIKADDWPDDMTTPVNVTFEAELPAAALRELERISAAISTEETRYYLNGIHMKKLDGWTYRFAATDGHRLMTVDIQLPAAVDNFDGREVIIPRRFIAQVFANFRKSEQPISFKIGGGSKPNRDKTTAPASSATARVSLDGEVGNAFIEMTGKTIDGTYPDYSRVIPTDIPFQAVFNVAQLRRAILAVAAGDNGSKTKPVKLAFDMDYCVLTAAHSVEGVSASYRVECRNNCTGFDYIGFNANYLLDMLAAIRSEEVKFGLKDGSFPATVHDVHDTAFMAVLMPMRV